MQYRWDCERKYSRPSTTAGEARNGVPSLKRLRPTNWNFRPGSSTTVSPLSSKNKILPRTASGEATEVVPSRCFFGYTTVPSWMS